MGRGDLLSFGEAGRYQTCTSRMSKVGLIYTICKRALSLADCCVLATAKINSAIAIFKKEQELLDELDKKDFDLRITILE